MTIIETIECTPNEETAFRIADECCTRMETLYDMEEREFTREHYIVYFTYFVFVENAVFRCGLSREKTPPAKPAGFAGGANQK